MSHALRTEPRRLQNALLVLLVVLTAPLWIVIGALVGAAYLVWVAALYLVVWTWWIGRAPQRVLFVYSDSPNWKDRIEEQVLPRLPADSVVLNWSRRQDWPRFAVSVLLFHAFAGPREFNPIALVFRRFAVVERFRFWRAFRDAKHGKPGALREVEAALFERAGRAGSSGS